MTEAEAPVPKPHLSVSRLRTLATRSGVCLRYRDVFGRVREADSEALRRVLVALGEHREDPRGAGPGGLDTEEGAPTRFCPPVIVVWDGEAAFVPLHDVAPGDEIECRIALEQGEVRRFRAVARRERRLRSTAGRTTGFLLPRSIPPGYHSLRVDGRSRRCEALIVSAPRTAYDPNAGEARTWGVFTPLYALRGTTDWGLGDLADLAALRAWVRARGGGLTGTLPLSATFTQETGDPSPYSPASRLFWNEIYIAVERLPEFSSWREAVRVAEDSAFRSALRRARSSELADHVAVLALKRRVMEVIAERFFAAGGEESPAYRSYLLKYPDVDRYARFRAVTEARRAGHSAWPERLRRGRIGAADGDVRTVDYHRFAQFAFVRQMTEVSGRGAAPELYLDLPLGVHREGYDSWKHRGLFLQGVSIGAPPDVAFTTGQDWGLPPIHPGLQRETGYAYLREVLTRQMQFAAWLRIDHVMGFHRQFYVPVGMSPQDGVYVRYPAEELYAVLILESHRNRCGIVGENLGTVPPEVNRELRAHGILGSYVLAYEALGSPDGGPRVPRTFELASLGTHDLTGFAGFWQGTDIGERARLGQLEPSAAARERRHRRRIRRSLARKTGGGTSGPARRTTSAWRALEGCVHYLAASPARVFLISMGDLALERTAHNIPASSDRHPNWRRRMRFDLGHMPHAVRIDRLLADVSRLRRGRPKTR